jgi:hypothetical protein
MYDRLEHQINRIERALRKIKDVRAAIACTCRGLGRKIITTRYHSAPEELKKILWVPCPVHGLRDPGVLMWTAKRFPLNREDWEFCSCPPHPGREFRMGIRPEPTKEETDQWIIDCNLEVQRQRLEPEEISKQRWRAESDAMSAVINEFYEAFNAARGLNAR